MRKKIGVLLILVAFLGNVILPGISAISYANIEDADKTNVEENENSNKNAKKSENDSENLNNEEKIDEDSTENPIEQYNSDEEEKIESKTTETEQLVKDGTYRISMFDNSSCHLALEIKDGSKNVEANVQLGTWVNKDNEKNKFQLTYDKTSGYYTIESTNSGKVLDVQNGGMTDGTNVWQHSKNGTDAQKWKIQKNEDESYSFVSKKNGLYLSAKDGNIQVNNGENKSEQKFRLICLDDKEERTIKDGVYKISSNADNDIVLQTRGASKENGAMIETGKWISGTSNTQRKFKVTYNEDDGYYTIESISSGKVFDAQNGGMTNGTKIWQYSGNYTDAQRWKIEKNSDGSYSLSNKKSGLYLDFGDRTTDGQTMQIYEKTDSNRQKFKLIGVSEKPEQYVEDGIYRISMFDNSSCHLALEIKDGSKNVEANVQLGTWVNKDNEKNKFQLTYDKTSGYYTIESTNSGKVLDVQNGGMTDGTNVWQHSKNGTDAQKWKIQKNEDESYSFVSKKNGLYLSAKDGNIQVNNGENKSEQKFKIISLENIQPKTIEDGIYKIETTANTNKVIEVNESSINNGANIKTGVWTETDNSYKKFRITYNKDDGYYTIEGLMSEKVFDAQNGGMTNGTNVWQYSGNYTDAQRWKIEKNSDGSYSLSNKKSDLYLTENNGNIEIRNKTGKAEQKFNIVKVSEINENENIEEGTYKIVVASNKNVAFDVKDASREKTANIQLGNASDTIRNEFNIVSDGKGYYIIRSINSGNVLDVQNGGMTSGTNVWQHGYNGTDAQKWIIRHNTSDDTYSIISKKNGLYLDVQNGNINVGGNIQVCGGNGTKAQKFSFVKQEEKSERWIDDGLYKILTKLDSTVGLDIESASKENGGIVQIWKYQNATQQQFKIVYNEGYYFIININSDKAVQATGTTVKQYDTDYSNDNQKWLMKYVDGKYYSFVSKTTGKCINIPDTKATNGTDLTLAAMKLSDNQLFRIEGAGIYIDENKYPGLKKKIDDLKAAHPNWNFEILYTGLDFNYVVNGEYSANNKKNCLVDTRTYQGDWIASNPYKSGVWYSASYNGIAYFMDPRNFLNEVDVFQFLELNGYTPESVTLEGIQKQIKGTFLEWYPNDLNNACRQQNVNPYYVIARLFQEQGRKGTTIGTGMDGKDGKTYYNPFNIGAKLGKDYETALATAKSNGWDSMKKALIGGIDFLKSRWLENYQNTLYQNKFDIDTRNGTSLFSHEYMQNVSAAYSEAKTLRNCYSSTNTEDSEFTFIVPVYENMPSEASARPSGKSSTNNPSTTSNSGPMDARVKDVSSTLQVRAEPNTSSKVLEKLSNGTELLSVKRALNGNWQQVVTNSGKIGYVSGDYIEFISDKTNCNKKKVVKTESGIGVKIRIGPSIELDKISALPDGTEVTVINTGTYHMDGYSWDRIILKDGTQAFAPADFLKEK